MGIALAIAATLCMVGLLILFAAVAVLEIIGHTTKESDWIFYAGACVTVTGVVILIVTFLTSIWTGVLK